MNPAVSMYINIAMSVLGVVAALSPSVFPSYMPDTVVKDVIQTAGLVFTIWGGVNTALHATSTAQAGPLSSERKPQ